jgi:hypothetical protein
MFIEAKEKNLWGIKNFQISLRTEKIPSTYLGNFSITIFLDIY